MAATGKLTVRAVFADDTTATISIDNINPTVGTNPNLRSIIMNFNANKGGELAGKMKSKNGYDWVGIDKAYFTITDRQYIF